MIDVVSRVAKEIFIPFSVGGGLRTVGDMRKVLLAGAEKISIDSGAVRDPDVISQGAKAFGSQCIVLSMQIKQVAASPDQPSGYEVFIDGARTPTGLDAVGWAIKGVELGAGEIVVNSIDADGTTDGYDVSITRKIAQTVGVPVIASGGAGNADHIKDACEEGCADAAIIASIIHFGDTSIPDLKRELIAKGVEIREP